MWISSSPARGRAAVGFICLCRMSHFKPSRNVDMRRFPLVPVHYCNSHKLHMRRRNSAARRVLPSRSALSAKYCKRAIARAKPSSAMLMWFIISLSSNSRQTIVMQLLHCLFAVLRILKRVCVKRVRLWRAFLRLCLRLYSNTRRAVFGTTLAGI